MIGLEWAELAQLCRSALLAAGSNEDTAVALTDAVLAAERRGVPAVGVAHLFDYLEPLRDGRINGAARPVVQHDRGAVLTVDADDGVAQLAYRAAATRLVEAAHTHGVAVLSIKNAFTVGELGYYTSEVASAGLVALAGANSTALMSLFGVPAALTGTNPLSFALPGSAPLRMFDQASSAGAWVRVREAATSGEPIPLGWAVDAEGADTTDALAALDGALLPAGGIKGSNIAMLIELLAVLSGAAFSIDAPDIVTGQAPPRVGLFLLALDPDAFSKDFLQRVENHFARLRREHGFDFGRYRLEVDLPAFGEDIVNRLRIAGRPHPASDT